MINCKILLTKSGIGKGLPLGMSDTRICPSKVQASGDIDPCCLCKLLAMCPLSRDTELVSRMSLLCGFGSSSIESLGINFVGHKLDCESLGRL